eukprot:13056062-Alexandrium_andersonii.AAC.1
MGLYYVQNLGPRNRYNAPVSRVVVLSRGIFQEGRNPLQDHSGVVGFAFKHGPLRCRRLVPKPQHISGKHRLGVRNTVQDCPPLKLLPCYSKL